VLSVVMNPGRADEQLYDLVPGAVTIGRTKDNAISCLHKSLSRVHARVVFDGERIVVFDLQSKNGVFVRGRRVSKAELREGDSFRCGDIQFLVSSSTQRTAVSVAATTLQSPLGASPTASKRPTKIPAAPVRVEPEEGGRGRERMLMLVRAAELLVGEGSLEAVLDELVVSAVQVLDIDRVCLLALDPQTAAMAPRIVKSFSGSAKRSWSQRVVNYVVDRGIAMAFADVSRDETLGGDPKDDARVRSALCAPINPGSGVIGALYADTVTQRPEPFRPDDLAVFRALASLAAVAMENDALRNAVSDEPARETLFGPARSRF
jgi:adenylate cyclase